MRNKLCFSCVLLIFVLLIAIVVRVWGIDKYPIGFTQDEAALGYDAYSLLTTGKDQWGNNWPLILRSFGDYKLPLYSYLAIPTIFIFGLNEFAVRLPTAMIGVFAVVATYLMISEITKNKKLAVISSLFLAISPWHISLSRGAFESNLTSFLFPLGVWGFFLGLRKPKWMFISPLAFGLNLFSYHSARYFTLFFIALTAVYSYGKIKKMYKTENYGDLFKKYWFSGVVALFFIIILAFSVLAGSQSRAFDIAIFNPTDKWEAVSGRRYEAVLQGFPDTIARLFSNKISYSLNLFAENYLNYLSPTFFFAEGVSEWSYGMIPGRGVLYFFEAPLLIVSLYAVFKYKKYKWLYLFLFWLILAPIPAALTKGPGFSGTRAATMMPALQVISSFGLWFFIDRFKMFKKHLLKFTLYATMVITVMVSFAFFLQEYFYHAPERAAKAMQYGTKEVVEKIILNEEYFDRVIISRSLSVPHIWIAFYKQIDPDIVQKNSADWLRYKEEGYVSVDQLSVYSIEDYIISGVSYLGNFNNDGKTLFVAKADEQNNRLEVIDTIEYPNNKPAYYLYKY